MVAAGPEVGKLGRRRHRVRQLAGEPVARIGADAIELAIGGAETKTIDRDEGFEPHGHFSHRRSATAARPAGDSCGSTALMMSWMPACSAWLRACIAS